MNSKSYLDYLNKSYSKLHSDYENAFWNFRIGISNDGEKMNKGEVARDAFRSNKKVPEAPIFEFIIMHIILRFVN